MAPKIATRKDGSPRKLVHPRCSHENADHTEVVVNGIKQIEWVTCLDCGKVITLRRGR